ncbi:hypothetical protein OGATHE_001386 [Ogataea polymorpha]|uniref:Uncharacterized protein n=1 Tax=Ogataea polymorpha TaxID=460523 RepID=A0A9P8TFX1_9ASCO|nr:hypothetical protein OGATHE_001386 [Ogataea polymorpha]
MVFPRPISSARIPLVPVLYKEASQLRPCFWYSLNVPRRRIGTGTSGIAGLSPSTSISSDEGGVIASPGSSLILLPKREASPGCDSSDETSSSEDSVSDESDIESSLSSLSSRSGSFDSSISFFFSSSVSWSTTLIFFCSPFDSTPYNEARLSGSSASESSSESGSTDTLSKSLYFSRSSSTVSLLSSLSWPFSSSSLSSLLLKLMFSSSSRPDSSSLSA